MEANIRKAAILVASLDSASASALYAQLAPAEAMLVRQMASELKDIDPEEQEAIQLEFSGETLPSAPKAARLATLNQIAGIELDGSLAQEIGIPRQGESLAVGPLRFFSSSNRFHFLEEADCGSLANLLAGEHPQTIAVVASHLSHEQAARLLAGLSDVLQVDVMRRIVNLDRSDPESLRELERQLESRMAEQSRYRRRRTAGVSAVSGILDAADPNSREILLTNLRRRDDRLARRVVGSSTRQPIQPNSTRLSFEQMVSLSKDVLRAVVVQAEPEILLLALTGADEQLIGQICRLLPSHVASALESALSDPEPINLRDVETAREKLTALSERIQNERISDRKSQQFSLNC